MILKACQGCRFAGEKKGNSFCKKEDCYSHRTNCIQDKALEAFLERETVRKH